MVEGVQMIVSKSLGQEYGSKTQSTVAGGCDSQNDPNVPQLGEYER